MAESTGAYQVNYTYTGFSPMEEYTYDLEYIYIFKFDKVLTNIEFVKEHHNCWPMPSPTTIEFVKEHHNCWPMPMPSPSPKKHYYDRFVNKQYGYVNRHINRYRYR
jgi:hypothetical protein